MNSPLPQSSTGHIQKLGAALAGSALKALPPDALPVEAAHALRTAHAMGMSNADTLEREVAFNQAFHWEFFTRSLGLRSQSALRAQAELHPQAFTPMAEAMLAQCFLGQSPLPFERGQAAIDLICATGLPPEAPLGNGEGQALCSLAQGALARDLANLAARKPEDPQPASLTQALASVWGGADAIIEACAQARASETLAPLTLSPQAKKLLREMSFHTIEALSDQGLGLSDQTQRANPLRHALNDIALCKALLKAGADPARRGPDEAASPLEVARERAEQPGAPATATFLASMLQEAVVMKAPELAQSALSQRLRQRRETLVEEPQAAMPMDPRI